MPGDLFRLRDITLITTLVVFLTILLIAGCAPLPPVEEEIALPEVADTGPQLSKAERDSIIRYRRSFAYERWKNHNYEIALEHFNIILKHDIEHEHNIYRMLADCYNSSELRDSALYAFEAGVKYFPDDDYLRSGLAIMYRNERRYDDAVIQQTEAVKLQPENEGYLRDLADLQETVYEWDKAIETYRKLLALLPDDAEISSRLIGLIREHLDPDEYLNAMREAVEKFPDDPARRFDYGVALMDQGKDMAALHEFEAYTGLRPDDPEGWRNISRLKENFGDYSAAISALNKVIELAPNSHGDMVAIGNDYLSMNSWTKARAWAYKALKVQDGYGPAWLLLGDVFYRAADAASGETPKYDDKLVFVIALGLFEKAERSGDPQAAGDGKRLANTIKSGSLVPSKEEWFFKKGVNAPQGSAYKWINPEWSEVGYIKNFLKKFE